MFRSHISINTIIRLRITFNNVTKHVRSDGGRKDSDSVPGLSSSKVDSKTIDF